MVELVYAVRYLKLVVSDVGVVTIVVYFSVLDFLRMLWMVVMVEFFCLMLM